jgi:hypothetical protein
MSGPFRRFCRGRGGRRSSSPRPRCCGGIATWSRGALDRILNYDIRHLLAVLREYLAHYNGLSRIRAAGNADLTETRFQRRSPIWARCDAGRYCLG